MTTIDDVAKYAYWEPYVGVSSRTLHLKWTDDTPYQISYHIATIHETDAGFESVVRTNMRVIRTFDVSGRTDETLRYLVERIYRLIADQVAEIVSAEQNLEDLAAVANAVGKETE